MTLTIPERADMFRPSIAIVFATLIFVLAPMAGALGQDAGAEVESAPEVSESADAATLQRDPDAAPPITMEVSDRLRRIFEKVPEDVADLKLMQEHIQKLSKRVVPCTVAVRLRGGMGSGVIISPDGYVMTAGHVVGRPDREVTIILHDGREVNGKTLGANFGIDSGLMKIMGDAASHPARAGGEVP